MKQHLLISAVVLGMAAHVQAQGKPVPTAPDPAPAGSGGAPQTKPVPKAVTPGATQGPDLGTGGAFGEANAITPPAVKPSRPAAEMSVTLTAGKLGDLVAEIEQTIQDWTINGGAEPVPVMPNIIFSADTRDAAVPGSLRLQGVSPVQALALACAAAGCTMEPIFAPAEGASSPGQSQQIIGYRIVRESAKARTTATNPNQYKETAGFDAPRSLEAKPQQRKEQPTLGGIGLALSKKDGGIVVGAIVPGSPAAENPAIKPGQRILSVADDGKPAVDTTSVSVENLVALLRGAPGTSVTVTFGSGSEKDAAKHTVTLVRAKLIPLKSADELIHETYENDQIGFTVLTPADPSPLPKVNVVSGSERMVPAPPGSGVGWVKPLGESAYLNSGMALPADNNRQIVRVYALRGILGGDTKDYGEKERACEELIAQALDKAGLRGGKERPDLSFHMKSRVLLVKATAAQQEIILQIIEALKENENQPVQKFDDLKIEPNLPVPLPGTDKVERPGI